ncbi:hypothetical protein [Leptospira sp. GIMC2001]|uniref:hypothetical protein n=1 Tax=Leptospira sp. GIMC2001 TaxID=1513297 RepID=UPI00234B023E|nr:hypothetical protein [Leptospira sp. GIMC2001]WCL50679.1 hypothetical protein O4O04_07675 [Leptospira sp. GIMC2001]
MKINSYIFLLFFFLTFSLFSDEIGRFKAIRFDTKFNDLERKTIKGKDCSKFEGVASISKAVENAIKIDQNIVGMYRVKVILEEFELFGNHCIYVEGYPRFKEEDIK